MHIRQARESDRDAVLGLYRELRPSDLPLSSDKASELWSKVNEAPRSQIIVAEHEGHVGATCMLALIANIASEGQPIGFIEHVVTAPAFRRKGPDLRLARPSRHEGLRQQMTREDNLRDVLAAYDAPVGHPTVAPAAVAIVGSSYSGYLTALVSAMRPVRWLALYRDGSGARPRPC